MVLDAAQLQPLVRMHDADEGITEVKYSPDGGPRMLAVASRDMRIYLYSVMHSYALHAR